MNHDISPESVDLIYLDPPFFTGKVQKGTTKKATEWMPGAMEISYDDSRKFWGDSDKVKEMRAKAPEWLIHISHNRPDFASYLYYMMERLQACHKVLKPTGSIYLHCDEKASHYLKMIMDDIFGYENYKNEIIWHYGLGAFRCSSRYPSKHDDILFYAKNIKHCQFNKLRGDVTKAMTSKYCHHDENGDYMMSYGKQYYLKGGKPIDDVWDLPNLSATDKKERVGYPTQKPLELLKRIINASSNEGDTVLDPFCGCGTAIVAAATSNRNWIGIDISKDAHDVSKGRILQGKLSENIPMATTEDTQYISRDLSEVCDMDGRDFEKWVNGFLKATKPSPDRGVDGIMIDGTPIQTKVYEVKYDKLSQFINDSKYHPKVPKPIKKIICVSQNGFDDSARKLKSQIESTDGINVELITPKDMLVLPPT
jgi:site-specific DNA-methyltransferase (adenine-specific)